MQERRNSHMYDPARDTFTNSNDASAQQAEEESLDSHNKRKRSSSPTSHTSKTPPKENKKTINVDSEPSVVKRARLSPTPSSKDGASPVPITAANVSTLSAKKRSAGSAVKTPQRQRERQNAERRRSRSPARASPESRRRERRSPARRRSPSPQPIARSPTPPDRSPPRQRKRPGGAARISTADAEAVKRRQAAREQEQNEQAQRQAAARGVHDVVRQHYNAVPQRGREWRKTESRIRGLRSFNNWIKSAIIQRFSPSENFTPGARERGNYGPGRDEAGLLVLDLGCGKGGDLQKWQAAPQRVDLYVALDPADVSIEQARERYGEMQRGGRGGYRNRPQHLFRAEFIVKDCFGEWLGTVPIIKEVGIDGSVGPGAPGHSQRWGGGGFDVVTMMFCMHYAFESEEKARGMLRNVAGSLKKGGRFLGVIPNSDIIIAKVNEYNAARGKAIINDDDDDWDPEKTLDTTSVSVNANGNADENGGDGKAEDDNLTWGNSIYKVKFPGKVPADGVFRPPFGWKYFFFLEEAVEEVPEYVVPWEAFRALAVEYDLELQFRRPFNELWDMEKDDPTLGPLSERMNVRGRDGGPLLVSEEELEAANFYHAFCFYKT